MYDPSVTLPPSHHDVRDTRSPARRASSTFMGAAYSLRTSMPNTTNSHFEMASLAASVPTSSLAASAPTSFVILSIPTTLKAEDLFMMTNAETFAHYSLASNQYTQDLHGLATDEQEKATFLARAASGLTHEQIIRLNDASVDLDRKLDSMEHDLETTLQEIERKRLEVKLQLEEVHKAKVLNRKGKAIVHEGSNRANGHFKKGPEGFTDEDVDSICGTLNMIRSSIPDISMKLSVHTFDDICKRTTRSGVLALLRGVKKHAYHKNDFFKDNLNRYKAKGVVEKDFPDDEVLYNEDFSTPTLQKLLGLYFGLLPVDARLANTYIPTASDSVSSLPFASFASVSFVEAPSATIAVGSPGNTDNGSKNPPAKKERDPNDYKCTKTKAQVAEGEKAIACPYCDGARAFGEVKDVPMSEIQLSDERDGRTFVDHFWGMVPGPFKRVKAFKDMREHCIYFHLVPEEKLRPLFRLGTARMNKNAAKCAAKTEKGK